MKKISCVKIKENPLKCHIFMVWGCKINDLAWGAKQSCTGTGSDDIIAIEISAGKMIILFSIFTFLAFLKDQIAFMSQRTTNL